MCAPCRITVHANCQPNVPDRIRQQLQVLPDLGLLAFLGSGEYHLS